MLYRKIIAVCSEIHTKHMNTQCGMNVKLWNLLVLNYILKIQAVPRSKHTPSLLYKPVN
jgi:hypothetical protein